MSLLKKIYLVITLLFLFSFIKIATVSAQTVDCSSYYNTPKCIPGTTVCGAGTYCTYITQCAVSVCQPPKADGVACNGMSECQPAYPNGDRACAATQCRAPGSAIQATCCPSGKFWCPSTNSCTAQDDGSCPCATDQPTATPTRTPTPVDTNTNSSGTTCSSSGIKSIKYDKTGCIPSYDIKAATVTCNDGFVVTKTASFRCESERTWQFNLQSVCSSHKTCPTPTPSPTATPLPTSTPSPTILATATPTPAVCDPNLDGITGDLLDYGVWVSEMLGAGTKKSDCYHPDNVIDLLDFQGWKDMFLSKLK